jgi:SAM-dependent methyltransferase
MAFEALKERQGEVWGSGAFELIEESIADMHDALVDALFGRAGEAWLDAGCGTGAIAERAAARGARVTGLDLAPALVETAVKKAQAKGLDIEYGVGDVENLPFADASFDVVASSVGAIFAPDHAQTARELARVTRPGGRLGLTAWCADGRVGDMFKTLGRFQPPPPEGAGSPLQWGDPGYAEALLGGAFDLTIERRTSVGEIESGEALWELFTQAFGPVVTLVQMLPEDQVEDLHRTFVDYAEQDRVGDGLRAERDYLLITGTRR